MSEIVTNISNPFSTGGGGSHFEERVQAIFVLSLLIDGFCPILDEPTKTIMFQAKEYYDVDDLVVIADRKGEETKLLCQMKRSINFNKSDVQTQSVIGAAWSDFNKPNFNRQYDRIALVTAQISYNKTIALRSLHSCAESVNNEDYFFERVNQSKMYSNDVRKVLGILKACIKKANADVDPSNKDLWEFCKVFILLIFDLDYIKSINKTLAHTLIKLRSHDNPDYVWSRLLVYAGECNQSSKILTIDTIDPSIKEFFERKEDLIVQYEPVECHDIFIPLVTLIGKWDEKNAKDIEIVTNVLGDDYEIIQSKIRSLITKYPANYKLEKSIFKVENRKKILEQISFKLFEENIKIFINSAKKVFLQMDKNLVQMNSSMLFQNANRYDNSFSIRKGMIEGIALIASNEELPIHCERQNIDRYINEFVLELFQNANWMNWASYYDVMTTLAEINPKIFIDNLENYIMNNREDSLRFFPSANDGIFGNHCVITEILFALEILAWDNEHLIGAIRCLGLLEEIEYPQTNWANTPINSIVAILLPWYPQTLANSPTRLNALKCLYHEHPTTFWKVIKQLLPYSTTTTSTNPKPKYSKHDIPEEIRVSEKELYEFYQKLFDLIVEYLPSNYKKIPLFIDKLGYMSSKALDSYIDIIENHLNQFNKSEKCDMWVQLYNFLNFNEFKPNMEIYSRKGLLENLLSKIEPTDIYYKSQILYRSKDYYKNYKKRENEKKQAVLEIYKTYGIQKLEEFSKEVNDFYKISSMLGSQLQSNQVSVLVKEYSNRKVSKSFFENCLRSFGYNNPVENLKKLGLEKYDESFIIDVLSMIDFNQGLLNIVNEFVDNKEEYWKKASFRYSYSVDDDIDIYDVTLNLMKCKRYITAINLIGTSKFMNRIPVDLLYDLLEIAGKDESIEKIKIDDYAFHNIIEYLHTLDDINIDRMSTIEFIYLPLLDQFSSVKPIALNTKIACDSDYFCKMIKFYFKNHSHEERDIPISKETSQRLSEILIFFNIVPGTLINGEFDSDIFVRWMKNVKKWSKENDRYKVTMQTVGAGLSYSNPGGNSLPNEEIIKELNAADNEELRHGYILGMLNQRGVHWVNPSGKEETAIAEKFSNLAQESENLGYSRYAKILNEIANNYRDEAKRNIERYKKNVQDNDF